MPQLHNTLAGEGARLLVNTLIDFTGNGIPQSSAGVTYGTGNILHFSTISTNLIIFAAPKVQPSMSEINWQTMNADHIYNLYRALYSFMAITTKWQNVAVKFLEISKLPATNHDHQKCGTVEYIKAGKYLKITCVDGQYIAVHRLGIGGRKTMSASDFNNGFIKKVQQINDRCFQS